MYKDNSLKKKKKKEENTSTHHPVSLGCINAVRDECI